MNRSREPHPVARALGIVMPLLILASAIAVSIYLVQTKPKPQTRPPRERAAMVETIPVVKTNACIRINAAGTVIPETAVALQPEVAGRVTALHPSLDPGGAFRKGDVLVELDERDYAFTLKAREAGLAGAEAAYRMELGHQDVARHEWELIPDRDKATELDRELALRQPQLAQAEAGRDAAGAALDQARLNIERTRVRAPFNGVTRKRFVNVGAQVGTQTLLAEIAGTDAFWVQVTVPVTDLRWIGVPARPDEVGSSVDIRPSGGQETGTLWRGRVIRRLPDLETNGRLAQLLVTVPEPLDTPEHPLLLGAYVDVAIIGNMASNVVSVPRAAYREDNRVWLRDAEGRLEVRPVEPLWGNQKFVYVREGLTEGEQLVTSDLATPIAGMKLTVAGEPEAAAPRESEAVTGRGGPRS